eukprot:SAG31_NODE_1641_length_7664_cov_3.789954_8_plen_33_part_01
MVLVNSIAMVEISSSTIYKIKLETLAISNPAQQ